jgi:hypothetical protein
MSSWSFMAMVGRTSTPLMAFVLLFSVIGAGLPTAAIARAAQTAETVEPPQAVIRMADWVRRSGDNQNLPFAIVDKGAAMVFVYDAYGEVLGATPALVGLTPGDDSTPGIGDRELSDIPPEERTTPAGRFVGGYGPAEGKREDVLWVDFSTAISLHAVVSTNPEERRVERLTSETVDDNRISYGCINVPKTFYSEVVRPTFSDTRGVFYILPDTKMLAEVFPDFAAEAMFASRGDAANPALSGPYRPSQWW